MSVRALLLLAGLAAVLGAEARALQQPRRKHPAPEQKEAEEGADTGAERIVLDREGKPLFMEHYASPSNAAAPVLVLFHQGRSSKAEYRPIVPRLGTLGYSCLAVDLSMGEICRGIQNVTAKRAFQKGRKVSYDDAMADMLDAIDWAREHHPGCKVVAWGSSYSASLALVLAARHPERIDGVIALSPGEYFVASGKSATWVRDSIGTLAAPAYLGGSESEAADLRPLLAVLPEGLASSFLLPGTGVRGSPALWEESAHHEECWLPLEAFLRDRFPAAPPPEVPAPPPAPPEDG